MTAVVTLLLALVLLLGVAVACALRLACAARDEAAQAELYARSLDVKLRQHLGAT